MDSESDELEQLERGEAHAVVLKELESGRKSDELANALSSLTDLT